jgi:signal transduction histidine kinase
MAARTCHRRQVVLGALVAAAAVSLILALLASQAAFWAVQVLSDVLVVSYLAVLIHCRNAAAHREMSHRALRMR